MFSFKDKLMDICIRMGVDFYLKSNNDINLTGILENIGLKRNWRQCGGVGCYTLLQALLRYDPTFCHELIVNVDIMKTMLDCVNYFIKNNTPCDENDVPEWCKNSVEYNSNLNIEIEFNEYTLNQATKLATWLKFGIENNCVILIG
jgi:hypothetical protein